MKCPKCNEDCLLMFHRPRLYPPNQGLFSLVINDNYYECQNCKHRIEGSRKKKCFCKKCGEPCHKEHCEKCR